MLQILIIYYGSVDFCLQKKKAGIPGNIGSAVILFLNLNYSFLFCSIYNTESTDTVLLNKVKIYYTRATCTSYVCVCVCVG